jgi:hypothetical protein
MADSDHDVVQPVQGAGVIVHVSRRHDGKIHAVRYVKQCSRERDIAPDSISLELDEKSMGAKYGFAAIGEPSSGADPHSFQRPWQQPITTGTGENDQPFMARFERAQRQPRVEALGAEVRFRQQTAEVRVPLWRFGQQDQV